MKRISLIAALILVLLAPLELWGQNWSTFLDPSRAIDWSTAGFSIPSYTVNCATQLTGINALVSGSGAASGNAAKIAAAIASCDATHNVVNIPAGTWSVASIDFLHQSKVVLRGAGANTTKLLLTADTTNNFIPSSISMGCNDDGSVFCRIWGNTETTPGGSNFCSWTGGYTKGATSITLNSCGGAPPVNSLIILDQANDSSDNGGYSVCDAYSSGAGYPCAQEGPNANANGRITGGVTYSQSQVVYVTAVSGSGAGPYTVTISQPIAFSNIRSGQSPGAWWSTNVMQNDGIENLTIDYQSAPDGLAITNCYQCWIKGVAFLHAPRSNVATHLSLQTVVRDSYFYSSQTPGTTESYAVELSTATSGSLIENNIVQQATAGILFGAGSGNVVGYNFIIDNQFGATNMNGSYYNHGGGAEENLWEGNILNEISSDDGWGASMEGTLFRNNVTGWQLGKNQYTYAISIEATNRAFNVIGNVLGQPSYDTHYESYATSTTTGVNGGDAVNTSVYALGWTGWSGWGGCSTSATGSPCDPKSRSTLMRWGNYDVVNSATRWDSTEASPGAVTYVGANFSSSYFGTLAHTLPNSLYYSSTPSWWPSGKAWPLIGPDVSSGNVGACTGTYAGVQATTGTQCTGGTLTTAWASHVTSNPAMDCAFSLNMPPDGSGGALNFNASTCYGASAPTVSTPTFSPTPGPYGSAQTVTLATSTTGATICYTTDGSTPTTNGGGSCVHGSIYSVPFSVASTETVKAIGTLSGDTDSSIATGVYTINGPAAAPTFSPVAGSYGPTQTVTISSSTTGATICWTSDGSTPTADGAGACTHGTTYSGTVSVSTSETLKAIASKNGWNDSSVSSAAYVINGAASTPTFSPAAGSYGPTQNVTISTSTSGATICYTTNGSTPASSSPGACAAGSTQYVSPVAVSSSLTLKAIATKSGYSDSAVGSAAYVINGSVADVTFSPVGGSYGPAQSVTLSTATAGAAICYTTDGSTPTASAGTCTHGTTYSGAITVSASETIYAIGTKSGYSESGVTGASYLINGTLSAPTFSPAAGSYGGAQTVTLSASGGGVTIVNQMTETSNLNDTAGHAVHRNVYTNCAEGYSGGSLQPTGVPVGNLYCTAADKTAALANGGPNLGVVSATTTNSGITGMENGMNAGGSDSAPTVTATYAGTTGTGCGVGATFTSNLFSGLTLPGEVSSSRAVFGLTTASSGGNTSMLAVSKYNTNGDTGNNLERVDCATPNTTSAGGQHYEWDSNYNTSGGSYMGFGMDYDFTTSKLRACFQNCSGWTNIELVPIGGGTTLTTYSWPANDYLFSERHDYWDAGCTYSSSSNCAYYGQICLQLWSAGSPVNSLTCYNIRNASTHGVISAKPINKTSWTHPQYGVQHQWDINSTSQTLTANVAFDSLVAFANNTTPTICYTTDGTTPTADGAGNCTHGTTYSAPISVAVTTTIKAIASEAGFTDSSVASATYTINGTVATPTFSPTAGTYATTQTVTISTVTGGATLCYTTDGSTPTTDGAGTCTHGTTYTTPVSVAVSQTIQAIGTESGFTDSALASASYTITGASAPTISGSVTITGTVGIQ